MHVTRPSEKKAVLRSLVVLIVLITLGGSRADSASSWRLHKQMRYLMGTLCEIQVYDSDEVRSTEAINAAFESMQRVERLLTNYDPESELSRMNQSAGKQAFFASLDLFDFMKRCQFFYSITSGAFDPTVGPLVRAWGFNQPRPRFPSALEIKEARTRIGFSWIELSQNPRMIRFAQPGMEVDPGGIGKGYAVDRAAEILKKRGITSALINTGGSSYYAIGSPPNKRGWTIGIKDPLNTAQPLALLELRDQSLSTSGQGERFVEVGRRRYGHVLDPRSGEPVQGIYEASVVAPTATESDALTKAAMVLTRAEVFQVLSMRPGVHALRVENPRGHSIQLVVTPWSQEIFKLRGKKR